MQQQAQTRSRIRLARPSEESSSFLEMDPYLAIMCEYATGALARASNQTREAATALCDSIRDTIHPLVVQCLANSAVSGWLGGIFVHH